MSTPLRIGNAQGFWGDQPGAAAQLISQYPHLDYLTMDYLAEVSMSILSLQRTKDASKGYAADFIDELKLLVPFWRRGYRFKVIANAGGLNPIGCAQAAVEVLKGLNLKVGVVEGDDVLKFMMDGDFPNLDTGESINTIRDSLVSANAYLGAQPIVEALNQDADIVITGRVADPSLTVGCAVAHFGWGWTDYDRFASATIAGHLIECGVQATGGISTNWLSIPVPENIGYPIVEMEENGNFVLTKPDNTGGVVNDETVKEQLLYEIGDPDHYITPDVIVSFLSLKLEKLGVDRIKVSGARGRPPPSTLKVSATYKDGYMAQGMLTVIGCQAKEKARRSGEVVMRRVKSKGFTLDNTLIECIGDGEECVMRVAVSDHRKEAVECFSTELAPLVTSGPQGITGYFGGRPKVRQGFGFWPCLIEGTNVKPKITILEGK